jgi:hypothetical protein
MIVKARIIRTEREPIMGMLPSFQSCRIIIDNTIDFGVKRIAAADITLAESRYI